MYIEAIIKVRGKDVNVAETMNHLNNILSTDYPRAEIIMAKTYDDRHKIEIDYSSDWEELIMNTINKNEKKYPRPIKSEHEDLTQYMDELHEVNFERAKRALGFTNLTERGKDNGNEIK